MGNSEKSLSTKKEDVIKKLYFHLSISSFCFVAKGMWFHKICTCQKFSEVLIPFNVLGKNLHYAPIKTYSIFKGIQPCFLVIKTHKSNKF